MFAHFQTVVFRRTAPAAPPAGHPSANVPLPLLPLPPQMQDVKAGLAPHFVDRYEQIYELAFGGQQAAQQAEREPAAATAA